MPRTRAVSEFVLRGAIVACGSGAIAAGAGGAIAACGSGAPARPVSGAEVFAQQCSACHSLIGNESLHRPGGDLVGYRMTRTELIEFTREMPVKRSLSRAELAAVVAYVQAAQRSAGR
ncbi:MAG: cytochrome c [Solirubrobacterales bacterium]|nr:cytochrome c [Solirubrobacterales bacterium]MBV9716621.1 cytochrome c [Solirubrobacterales bacterium]